ncbi:MAG: RNA-binding transcriptional accessory protein [Spirochaetaceae bacterium]|nr:MAG: RNA-binding transcriptional accessory protein [Spirochaetaceae bacterium]
MSQANIALNTKQLCDLIQAEFRARTPGSPAPVGDLPQSASIRAVLELLDEGATVPFIARYRKEHTGNADEEVIRSIEDAAKQVRTREARRAAVRASLEKLGMLSEELSARLDAAPDISSIEDLYAPYKPKRKTRASAAIEAGYAPLAYAVLCGGPQDALPLPGSAVAEEAVAGAVDILAEWFSEHPDVRAVLRQLFSRSAVLKAKKKRGLKEDGESLRFKDYFEHAEAAARAPSHRILAMFRGETEDVLRLSTRPEEEASQRLLLELVTGRHRQGKLNWDHIPEELRLPTEPTVPFKAERAVLLERAVEECCSRLIVPQLESELRGVLKERADAAAVEVFARNLHELLMTPPLPDTPLLALDPGLRTGCKVVCLDARGGFLEGATIFPLVPHKKTEEAARIIRALLGRHGSRAVAVGNGTGGREALAFIESLELGIPAIAVSEAGASVYSASVTAREEFPDLDVTVRGAISIGRRLADPLSELVKIDPKAIGVGQYQHDVDQKRLQERLDAVVLSCVNRVGVDLNTAGKPLLSYVSGMSGRLADAVVKYRGEVHGFQNRKELLKVAGLGPKSFEQAAGFLRIRGGNEPLDAGAVHPERYDLVRRMARDQGVTPAELMSNADARSNIDLESYVSDDVGLPTLHDIMQELEKPGRDPRGVLETVRFADVHELSDLSPGMRLPGVVTNITAFGAFVDVGVHQDGLVHISKLANRFVSDPHEVVQMGKQVMVTVLEVDAGRKRISLSMLEP